MLNHHIIWASPMEAPSTCNAGDTGEMSSIPGLGGNGNPLSILAWKISRAEESDRLQYMGS